MGQAIRQLLVDCWNRDAIARPSFRTIIDRIRLMQTAPAKSAGCPGETHLSLAPEAPQRLALRCCISSDLMEYSEYRFRREPGRFYGGLGGVGWSAASHCLTKDRETWKGDLQAKSAALRTPPARPHRRPPSAIAAPNARSTTACPDRLGLVFVSGWAVLFVDGSVAGGTLSTHIGYSKYSSHRSA
jgi:hypothetical protein